MIELSDMNLEKTKKLMDWLEDSQHSRQFSMEDMKDFLSIAIAELDDQSNNYFDIQPETIIEAIIDSRKASGEYYRLENKIKSFKSRFTEQSGKSSEA